MPEVEAQLDRIESHIERLARITGELARDVRSLVEGLASDRVAFRETLRDLSGFVATIAENNRVIRQLLDILARGRGDGEGPPSSSR